MPIGPEILQIGAQLQASVFFGETLNYLGRAKSKRQFSSAEAEYRAMAYTTGEIVWLRW